MIWLVLLNFTLDLIGRLHLIVTDFWLLSCTMPIHSSHTSISVFHNDTRVWPWPSHETLARSRVVRNGMFTRYCSLYCVEYWLSFVRSVIGIVHVFYNNALCCRQIALIGLVLTLENLDNNSFWEILGGDFRNSGSSLNYQQTTCKMHYCKEHEKKI